MKVKLDTVLKKVSKSLSKELHELFDNKSSKDKSVPDLSSLIVNSFSLSKENKLLLDVFIPGDKGEFINWFLDKIFDQITGLPGSVIGYVCDDMNLNPDFIVTHKPCEVNNLKEVIGSYFNLVKFIGSDTFLLESILSKFKEDKYEVSILQEKEYLFKTVLIGDDNNKLAFSYDSVFNELNVMYINQYGEMSRGIKIKTLNS